MFCFVQLQTLQYGSERPERVKRSFYFLDTNVCETLYDDVRTSQSEIE